MRSRRSTPGSRSSITSSGNVASATGAAFVDINGFFHEVATEGFDVAGVTYTTDFLTGGTFSMDGVHPTPTGYAVTAN